MVNAQVNVSMARRNSRRCAGGRDDLVDGLAIVANEYFIAAIAARHCVEILEVAGHPAIAMIGA